MSKAFDLLKQGLNEAIEHAQKKRTLRTKTIHLPDFPKKYHAKDVFSLRSKLKCSQKVLASILNVSVKTVQSWESGKRIPTSTTNRLLEILDSKQKRDEFFKAIQP